MDTIGKIRRFNRSVTQRLGVLTDRFLSLQRPLGEARVLWEVGENGCDVKALRERLELDSGYLSRLLRALEADGVLKVEPSPQDKRIKRARLTRKGVRERQLLDRRSDELAQSLLEPLDAEERKRLVKAMAEVERLLTTPHITIEAVPHDHPEAVWCLQQYFAELNERFEGGFDVKKALSTGDGLFLLARLHGEPIGCGGLKHPPGQPTEIKRMWVAPRARGLGLARRLLSELETRAREDGAEVVRLDSNRALQEAIRLYRSAGYMEVEPFNDEPHAHHWFEKVLD